MEVLVSFRYCSHPSPFKIFGFKMLVLSQKSLLFSFFFFFLILTFSLTIVLGIQVFSK